MSATNMVPWLMLPSAVCWSDHLLPNAFLMPPSAIQLCTDWRESLKLVPNLHHSPVRVWFSQAFGLLFDHLEAKTGNWVCRVCTYHGAQIGASAPLSPNTIKMCFHTLLFFSDGQLTFQYDNPGFQQTGIELHFLPIKALVAGAIMVKSGTYHILSASWAFSGIMPSSFASSVVLVWPCPNLCHTHPHGGFSNLWARGMDRGRLMRHIGEEGLHLFSLINEIYQLIRISFRGIIVFRKSGQVFSIFCKHWSMIECCHIGHVQ